MNKNFLVSSGEREADIRGSFELLFKTNFRGLHAYAYTIIKDDVMAEEVVQNVFCRLWEKKEQLNIQQSAKSYLYRSVHNESINYLRHLKVKESYEKHALRNQDNARDAAKKTEFNEFQLHLHKAMNELPEQCRTIFQMSRFEELKYREIADEMGLSIKTVENQMGKALKVLRAKLVDFIPALIISLLNL